VDGWQGILVYIGAAALGLAAGLLVLLIIYKVWPWYTSRSRKASFANNETNNVGVLTKESRNRYREDIQIITAPAENELQRLRFTYENRNRVNEKSTDLQESHRPEEIFQRVTELTASARRLQDIRSRIQAQIDRLSREDLLQEVAKEVTRVEQEAESIIKTQESAITDISGQALGLNEIETNLKIATTPWNGKPAPFQTKIWDTRMGEFDSLVIEHSDDLGQAYIDMAMANQIVWFCTEIGYSSDDLKTSYKKLCIKIAERLTTVFGERLTATHV
jgi:hypothetical protein